MSERMGNDMVHADKAALKNCGDKPSWVCRTLPRVRQWEVKREHQVRFALVSPQQPLTTHRPTTRGKSLTTT